MHRDIQPCLSHGQMKGQTMEKAVSYQQPQQWEYRPLPQTPLSLPCFYTHNISGRKQSWCPSCSAPVGRQYPGLEGSRNATAGRKRENTQPQTEPGMLLLTCHRGNPNSSACGTPPASHDRAWARGSSGELPSHASAWHCKETPVSPLGKGEKGSGAANLFPSIPACTQTPQSAAQGQQEYFCYFSSHMERKKKIKKSFFCQGLPSTHNRAARLLWLPGITPSKAQILLKG